MPPYSRVILNQRPHSKNLQKQVASVAIRATQLICYRETLISGREIMEMDIQL